MDRDYWIVAEDDVIEFQVRSSLNADGPVDVGRVVHVGEIIPGAPGFRLFDGRVYLFSDLRMLNNLSEAAASWPA
jgi:hypothetical protein